MSNAASLRGPRRVRQAPPPPSMQPTAAAPATSRAASSVPPPLPPRASSGPPPLPRSVPTEARVAQSMTTQPTPSGGHAPVRIVVRPDAAVASPASPQMSPANARLLGTTMRVDRGSRAPAPQEQAWKPFRGFVVGASLGAAVMMVFTASGSDRVRDMRAWVASSLRTMKSDTPARMEAPVATTAAAAPTVVPVVDVQTIAAAPSGPATSLSPSPAPASCATASRTSAAPLANTSSATNTIPQLDVLQLPKAKPARSSKAKRATPAPRVENHDDEPEPRSGDEA